MPTARNLLVILTRGLRSDALQDERAWPLATPKLQALSDRGLRLVTISACPGDPGGRASVLTGLHARQHGLLHDRDATQPTRPRPGRSEPTRPLDDGLPHRLRAAGYHVAGVGQVESFRDALHRATVVAELDQLNPPRCDYFRAMQDAGLAAVLIDQRKQRLRSGPFEPIAGGRLLLEVEQDPDGFIAAAAARALQDMPTDRPWALFVVFSGPGNDLPPPTLYSEMVPLQQLAGGFVPVQLTALDALAEPAYPRVMLQRLEPHFVQRIRADYLGRVAMIDHCVGRLSDGLTNRADRSRTWTCLTSDHGYLLGEHGLIGRRSFFYGAVHTPLLLAPPPFEERYRSPDVEHGLYSSVDVAPTLAALAGCDMAQETAGRSLLPLLQGGAVLPQFPGDSALSEFNDRLMLETEQHKAVFHRVTRQCLGLYDLVSDPDERVNLLTKPHGMNALDALRWRLAEALLPLRAWAA